MTDRSAEDSSVRQGLRGALLSERFVALADTLVADYDVVELLEGLIQSCVDVLDVDEGGLLLADQRGNLQVVAASNEATRLVELLQLQSDEGPCLECVATGVAVSAPDLSAERERWPTFASAAISVGFSAVHALPMRLRDETIGALNLFTSQVRPGLEPEDLRIAQALADVATIGILQQRVLSRTSLLAEQLQTALNSRVVVEQAKGVLAERGRLDMQAAFDRLRQYARSHNERLSDVAGRVVQGELAPDTVLGAPPADSQG
ncbi:GAF and ANTAR domain-containing protein [Nocardioides caricicola]|uniref:GAF and ANTAR domain-containing protein n=1 Tax=Nocardioides caricicola TaxID=634770 RepID=A0ABW0N9J2_9ACTN